jgi:hypothetical protein
MVAQNTFGDGSDRFPSSETVSLVEATLTAFLDGTVDDARVCEVFSHLAREADTRQLRAEGMLVAFKQIWDGLPQVRALRDSQRREQLRAHLVRLCIDSYYKR